MFSLDLPTEDYWIALPQGVRVQVRPLDSMTMAAAQSFATSCAQALIAARAERTAAGLPADDIVDLSDADMAAGFAELQLAAGLARFGMIAWEGIGDRDGNALPFSRDGAERLARHPLMTKPFLTGYFAALERLAAEGNGSALSLNGPTAEGATIAGTVSNSAANVLAS